MHIKDNKSGVTGRGICPFFISTKSAIIAEKTCVKLSFSPGVTGLLRSKSAGFPQKLVITQSSTI